MDRIINIDGREVKFRATARTPRLYRMLIGRDMITDMNKLSKSFAKVEKASKDATEEEQEEARLTAIDLQIFEDTAYIMARHADPEMEYKTADEWLDTFDMFSIYDILPQLLDLWALNNVTTSSPKKNTIR